MYNLYHYPLCPFSRLIRMIMNEKEIRYNLTIEHYWERRPGFALFNPAFEVPVLVDEEKSIIIAETSAIYEFLEQMYPDKPLLGNDPYESAEVRRLAHWFSYKFYREVTQYIINERILRSYLKQGEPNSAAIRAAKSNIFYHIDYITFLLSRRQWIAGDQITLADYSACAQLSVLDYLGDVPWSHSPAVKEWYAIMKSRPSFRPLLKDQIPGFAPSKQYSNLDF